jgi:hypothetical protein
LSITSAGVQRYQLIAKSGGNFEIYDQSSSATRLTLTQSGNLGLGVTPSAWGAGSQAFQNGGGSVFQYNNDRIFIGQNNYINASFADIYTTSNYATRYRQYAGTHAWFNAPSGTAGDAITFTQAMTLDASGNLNIGNTGINSNFRLNLTSPSGNGGVVFVPATDGAIVPVLRMLNAAVSTNVAEIGTASGTALYFSTGGTERARIDSSGNFLFGTSALSGNGLVVYPDGSDTDVPLIDCRGNSASNSLASYRVFSVSLGQDQFYVSYAGTVFARSTSISALSDQREKQNIRTLETGLTEVLALQPRRFDWKNGQGNNIAGFIAQEVEAVLPDLIDEYNLNDTEKRMALKMGDMIPTLVKAIQEQQAIIESLKARLDAANL